MIFRDLITDCMPYVATKYKPIGYHKNRVASAVDIYPLNKFLILQISNYCTLLNPLQQQQREQRRRPSRPAQEGDGALRESETLARQVRHQQERHREGPLKVRLR